MLEQLRLDRVVDRVEDDRVGRELRRAVAQRALVDVGVHPHGGGVDEDVAATVAEAVHGGGDDAAAVAVELRGQGVGLVARAVVDDDGGAAVCQRRDGGAARAAGADDRDAEVG